MAANTKAQMGLKGWPGYSQPTRERTLIFRLGKAYLPVFGWALGNHGDEVGSPYSFDLRGQMPLYFPYCRSSPTEKK